MFAVSVSDHGRLLGLGGLHLQRIATREALVAEQVIGRRLPGLDDEDALGGQRGEDGQRVHIDRDPGGKRGRPDRKYTFSAL